MSRPEQVDAGIDVRRAGRRRGNAILAFGAIIMFGLFGVAVWYGYTHGMKRYLDDGPPRLIKAPEAPFRVKPEDRGGMEVPNRDRLIYEALNEGGDPAPVERLLPPPEEPLEPPKLPQGPVLVAPREAPPPPAPAVAKSAPPPLPSPGDAAETVQSPPEDGGTETGVAKAEPSEPAAGAAPPPIARDAYRIQIASYRDPATANAGWEKLVKSHPNLLKPLSPDVVWVDLGGNRGIYYRLMAGPLPDKDAAQALCEELRARRVGCLVVKP